jgi:hypothetical protein
MRYYVPALFAAGLACAAWIEGVQGRIGRILLAAVIVTSIPGLFLFGRNRILASRDVGAIDVAPAVYVRELTGWSGEARVACADAGAMKWLASVHVLDVDALVTPRDATGAFPGSADYAVLFPRQYADLIESAGPRLRPLSLFRSPSPVICGEDEVVVFEVVRESAEAGS